MKTYTYPMVGMHYRPPANALVQVLPVNTRMTLMAEPYNEFDSNAIGVWVDMTSCANNTRINKILMDHENGNLMPAQAIKLGYLPKDIASYLRKNGFPSDTEVEGKFYIPFGSNKPHVRFDLEGE